MCVCELTCSEKTMSTHGLPPLVNDWVGMVLLVPLPRTPDVARMLPLFDDLYTTAENLVVSGG